MFISTVNLKEIKTLKQAEPEEYQGIYFRDSKIGFVVNRDSVGSDNKQLFEQEAIMNLNITQAIQAITL
ncbi:MAG: hypothetical protein KJ630_22260 [Proteobacteria bacterium]|nr:hypothetical protein [Pseudomonadota bacterium]